MFLIIAIISLYINVLAGICYLACRIVDEKRRRRR